MLKRLRQLFLSTERESEEQQLSSPAEIAIGGAPAFPLDTHLASHEGYPILDWNAATAWIETMESAEIQNDAWTAIQRGWLLHLREALGPEFRLAESGGAMLLSSLEPGLARVSLDYVDRTLQRLLKLLDGIARAPQRGKNILILMDSYESYYGYVSYYYSEAGEFASSGGMHVNAGCSHYVTLKNDLRAIEPIIAHEMTHGCVSHLPLPAWLNEGLAVNTERRLAAAPVTHTPQQLRAMHLAFWREEEIQEFWSGKSFLRTDNGNLLSYDLARLIVEQVAEDWEHFKQFVLTADGADAGAAAALTHLGIDLGEFVCALLERENPSAWTPKPGAWVAMPEPG